jgi:hypothetical protein
MKHIVLFSLLLTSLLEADAQRSCPAACPSASGANFCNLNAEQLCISGSSVVGGDLTVCGSIFNPGGQLLNPNFNAEIFFTAGDMNGLQIGQDSNPDDQLEIIIRNRASQTSTLKCISSFPENKLFTCGWEMPLDRQKGIYYVTTAFGMPKNINLAITPVIDIHFFTTGRQKDGYVNFGIGANFLQDKEDTGAQMTFQKLTGNITVSSPQSGQIIRHFMVTLPIDDITMKPQTMGQLYVGRIDIDKGPLPVNEYQDSIYIAAINFRYRMEPVA